MSDFYREERYIVVKLKRIDEDQLKAVRGTLDSYHIPTEQCVVVEHDWPIYEQTWDAIRRLAEGHPQQAQGEAHDWSNAPEGATHYQPHQKAYYKRFSAFEWYVWSKIEDDEPRRWMYSPATSDSAKWIVRPPTPAAVPDGLVSAVKTMLENDGRDGTYDATRLCEARELVEHYIYAAPSPAEPAPADHWETKLIKRAADHLRRVMAEHPYCDHVQVVRHFADIRTEERKLENPQPAGQEVDGE